MTHKRTIILNEIVQTLKGKTIAGQNVAYSFTPKPQMNNLPVVLVYAQNEEIEQLSQAPREMRRNLFVTVEAIADGSDDVEMTVRIDDLADEIEQLLSEDDTLNCSADDILLSSVQFQYEGEDIENPIGSCRLIYQIKYRDFFPREQVNVDDFDSIKTEWDISPQGEPDGNFEAEDIINIE